MKQSTMSSSLLTLALVAVAAAGLSRPAVAAPATFTDLGNIGAPGEFVFDTSGSGFDTELGLWDEAGTLLASNDDSVLGLESQITISLGAGSYFLGISEFASIFADDFSLTGTRFESEESATAVLRVDGTQLGSLLIGEVAGLDENAFFKVSVGEASPVPLPASLPLLLAGLAGFVALRRKAAA